MNAPTNHTNRTNTMQTRADVINALRSRPRVPVTVIGGGINGAGVFRDLSLQGIDCLIIDKPRLRDELDGRMVYFGSADGRICLVYPFMGHLLLGSTDLRADDPDRVRCDDDEIAYLLNVLREVFPGAGVKADDVVYRYSGVRPLPFSEAGDTGEISRDHSIKVDESPDGGPPVLSWWVENGPRFADSRRRLPMRYSNAWAGLDASRRARWRSAEARASRQPIPKDPRGWHGWNRPTLWSRADRKDSWSATELGHGILPLTARPESIGPFPRRRH